MKAKSHPDSLQEDRHVAAVEVFLSQLFSRLIGKNVQACLSSRQEETKFDYQINVRAEEQIFAICFQNGDFLTAFFLDAFFAEVLSQISETMEPEFRLTDDNPVSDEQSSFLLLDEQGSLLGQVGILGDLPPDLSDYLSEAGFQDFLGKIFTVPLKLYTHLASGAGNCPKVLNELFLETDFFARRTCFRVSSFAEGDLMELIVEEIMSDRNLPENPVAMEIRPGNIEISLSDFMGLRKGSRITFECGRELAVELYCAQQRYGRGVLVFEEQQAVITVTEIDKLALPPELSSHQKKLVTEIFDYNINASS